MSNTPDGVLTAEERRRRNEERMLREAETYAAFDRTDPFAMDRARAHIKCGVASISRPENRELELTPGPGYYSATFRREMRSIEGLEEKVPTVSYFNVARP